MLMQAYNVSVKAWATKTSLCILQAKKLLEEVRPLEVSINLPESKVYIKYAWLQVISLISHPISGAVVLVQYIILINRAAVKD